MGFSLALFRKLRCQRVEVSSAWMQVANRGLQPSPIRVRIRIRVQMLAQDRTSAVGQGWARRAFRVRYFWGGHVSYVTSAAALTVAQVTRRWKPRGRERERGGELHTPAAAIKLGLDTTAIASARVKDLVEAIWFVATVRALPFFSMSKSSSA